MTASKLYPVCNTTKWQELRIAILGLPANERPEFRNETLKGFVSTYDREWFYHFYDSDYADILHVDIRSPTETCDQQVRELIDHIGLVVARQEPLVWRVYGYVDNPPASP